MRPRRLLGWLAASLLGTSPPTLAADCSAVSGAQRATLVELFTSEGCSSCPPADRWLSGFASRPPTPARPVIPLAFHVDYWDYIGWADRFASPIYTTRQKARMAATHGRFIYTPQTLIDGRDSSAWRQAGGPGQLPSGPPVAAGAKLALTLALAAGGPGEIHLLAEREPNTGREAQETVAYLAIYENGLHSEVGRGENAGQQLKHDYVVREWLGPFPFDGEGRLDIRQHFKTAGIDPGRSGVAAIVESRDGSRYLQALALPMCR